MSGSNMSQVKQELRTLFFICQHRLNSRPAQSTAYSYLLTVETLNPYTNIYNHHDLHIKVVLGECHTVNIIKLMKI